MVIRQRSDQERKAMFSNMNKSPSRESGNIQMVNPPGRSRQTQPPKLPKNIRSFISDKISKLIREGVPQNVAIGRAFSNARDKFGKDKVPKISSSPVTLNKKTERLLISLLGLAIFLSIIKRIRSNPGNPSTTFFSYVDGRNLGKFDNMEGVFMKFPKEREAFNKVKRFNKKTGKDITTTKQIPVQKKKMKISSRWDQ